MNDIEWESFIQMLSKKGEEVNLKKECKKKGVGLDTLYSKVNELNHKEDKKEIAKRFLYLCIHIDHVILKRLILNN